MQWGEKGPRSVWDPSPDTIDTGVLETRGKISDSQTRKGGPRTRIIARYARAAYARPHVSTAKHRRERTQQRKAPLALASLRSGLGGL